MSSYFNNPKEDRIIFFDLEYFVPKYLRNSQSFSYNPWHSGCRLLGGSFYVASPATDLHDELDDSDYKLDSFWLWNYPSEETLVEAIFLLLKESSEHLTKISNHRKSPLLCGIGITCSDVPTLMELFKKYGFLSKKEAFVFQNSFRVLDLSQAALGAFNNSTNLLYPLPKNTLLSKFVPGTIFESGREVWGLYDSKAFSEIESRCRDEVICTHRCYVRLLENIRYLKNAEQQDLKYKREYYA